MRPDQLQRLCQGIDDILHVALLELVVIPRSRCLLDSSPRISRFLGSKYHQEEKLMLHMKSDVARVVVGLEDMLLIGYTEFQTFSVMRV